MDPSGNTTSRVPRKVRFAPKPQRRVEKPVVPKTEQIETTDANDAQAKELMQRFNEAALKVKPKSEKKVSSTQVAFGYGSSSTYLKSYGPPKGGIGIAGHEGGGAYPSGSGGGKEYEEPWDYYGNYPVTLPLRRPYSGNPELLDEEEFGEAAESKTYDENLINSASELGLMEEKAEPNMFFLQLPAHLPMVKKTEAQKTANSSKSPMPGKPCSINELPAGFMGKMLVYKSGAVKLKLGDTLYDVSPGSNCTFAQDVVTVNTEKKNCCVIGELGKHTIITPDVDSILDNI